jgi:formylglycine-generating enzyme required for sulfatase activity
MGAGTRHRTVASAVIAIAVSGCGSRTGLPSEPLPDLPATESGPPSTPSHGDASMDAAAQTTTDAASDATGIGVCLEGSLRCSNAQPQMCGTGTWQNLGAPCQNGCVNGTCDKPPSCRANGPGLSNCGPGSGDCCASLQVPGGTFFRSYDGVNCPGGPGSGLGEAGFAGCYTSKGFPASISTFRLDRYEVTVGRFRQFVRAVTEGWLPAAGSGKHAHLNGGRGLANAGLPGHYEDGWDPSWSGGLARTEAEWDSNLTTCSKAWTLSPGPNENLPIDCETWYEAFAFCIWDGGFLPSEAEWNYAAAGGNEQRVFPWSSPPTATIWDCSYANGGGDTCGGQANAVGSESPKGDGKWHQSDLSGNSWEWSLDELSTAYVTPCSDCANLRSAPSRVLRGGDFNNFAVPRLLTSNRSGDLPTNRSEGTVGRCARAP